MTDLVLTEKFSVASDFARALGAKKKGNGCFEGTDVVVTWAVGHLVELFEPDDYDPALKKWKLDSLPLIPERFQYKPIKRTGSQFKIIKNLLKTGGFSRVILATDAGREGEVIARTILLESGFRDKGRVFRFWTSQALVPEVVRQTMKQVRPMTDYDRLWRAGYFRQVSDWLIGMNCTRVLTIRLKDLFSVGRVQTAVLALLVDRKQARDTFIPEPYWIIKAQFHNDKGQWKGQWFKGKENRLTRSEEARALHERFSRETLPGSVRSMKREKKKEAPPFLFSLTDLQQEANKRFGFPAQKTLDIAQRLYQDKKCLSYPRTDSRVLGTQSLDLVKEVIKKLGQAHEELFIGLDPGRVSLSNRRVFNDAKLTDHHALIPFKPLPASASNDEKKIFDLVLRRFAAAFHPDCESEITRVITVFGRETFGTRGKIIQEPGWQRVWTLISKGREEIEHIPPLVQGDPAHGDKISMDEKQTRPPADYTDSLLLKDMTNPGRYVAGEALKKLYRGDIGIGTQSTRAQIIETLIRRNYVVRSGKQLLATDKGVFLVKTLRQCPVSSVLTSPEETARWEMSLNRISLGEDQDSRFLTNMKSFVIRSVNELKTAGFDVQNFKADRPEAVVVGQCPGCGGPVRETKKAYSCTDKACGFVIWKRISGKGISPKMAANLIQYGKSGPLKGFISKKKKRFSATLVIKKEQGKYKVGFEFDSLSGPAKEGLSPGPAAGSDQLLCPVCGGRIIEGKKGYGCANWRPEQGNCLFVVWKKISGKALTFKNVETLVKGKTTRAYVFKDKNNEPFTAKLRMVQKSGKGFGLELVPKSHGTLHADLWVSCSRLR